MRLLLGLVIGAYRLDLRGIHGITHWARVLENGRRLATLTGADPAVVELFSVFHDACRHTDGHDPDHGPRAAALVRGMREQIGLDDARFDMLVEACACHTRGPRAGAAVTILTCLEADRLDIPRVGLRIRPELLFSDAARDPSMMRWASVRAIRRVVPELCSGEWGWGGTAR
jgi:uncharacterized protein